MTVLMANPNVLILDEPTNDLDVLTLNVLEDYLMHFPGCLIMISHDRYFMDKLVDHLFVMEGDGFREVIRNTARAIASIQPPKTKRRNQNTPR